MKRAFPVVLSLSFAAALGGGVLVSACIGDGPGPLPALPGSDGGQPDVDNTDHYVPPAFEPTDLGTHLALWLDGADSESVKRDANQSITQWSDKSTFGRNYMPGTSPVYSNSAINDKPGVVFMRGYNQFLVGPSFKSLKSAEVFVVLKCSPAIDTNPLDNGLWKFGAFADYSLYPANNAIYDAFGSANRQPLFDVTTVDLTKAHIFEEVSIPDELDAFFDGVQVAGPLTNAVTFETTGSVLAASGPSGLPVQSNWKFFSGAWGELIIFDEKLSPSERHSVQTYLSQKWDIPLKNPDGGK